MLLLPQEKIGKVAGAVSALLELRESSQRYIMKVLGLMTTCIPAVPWAQLHSGELQSFLLSSWDRRKEYLDEKVSLPGEVRALLKWWLYSDRLTLGQPWAQWNPVRVTTDTISWRWGAHLKDLQAKGSWDPGQVKSSCNHRWPGGQTGPKGVQGQDPGKGSSDLLKRGNVIIHKLSVKHQVLEPTGLDPVGPGVGGKDAALYLCGPHKWNHQHRGRFCQPIR